MKYVKGVAICLVLCFAAFGVFTLLKPPPQVDLSDENIRLAESLGMDVGDGGAAETGLSAVFCDVEIGFDIGLPSGVPSNSSPPPGLFGGSPSGTSTPPSHFGGGVQVPPVPPPPVTTDPRVAMAGERMQTSPDFFAPVLPAPNFAVPADPFQNQVSPSQSQPSQSQPSQSQPSQSQPSQTPQGLIPQGHIPAPVTEFPTFETSVSGTPPVVMFPVSAAEAPPPLAANRDGPAISFSSPQECLQSHNSSPITPPNNNTSGNHTNRNYIAPPITFPFTASPLEVITAPPQEEHFAQHDFAQHSVAQHNVVQHNVGGVATRASAQDTSNEITLSTSSSVGENVRRIGVDSENRDSLFSSSNSVSITPTPTPVRFIQTSVRQQPTFEPVRPAASPNDPIIVFGQPRQISPPPQPEQRQQPEQVQPARMIFPASPSLMSEQEVQQQAQQNVLLRFTESPVISPAEQHIAARQFVSQPQISDNTIERFIQTQRQHAESGDPERMRNAFIQLSQLYEHPQLGETERTMMHPVLDALALNVIYSRDTHLLEPAYRVKPGETIESIARNFLLTPTLLRKINGLSTFQEPVPGTMLKVVIGQFDARISIQRRELTLLLGGLYAGRVPFTLSNPALQTHSGEFPVTHKSDRRIELKNGWVLATAQAMDATIIFTDQDAGSIFDILCGLSVIVVE